MLYKLNGGWAWLSLFYDDFKTMQHWPNLLLGAEEARGPGPSRRDTGGIVLCSHRWLCWWLSFSPSLAPGRVPSSHPISSSG